MKEAVISYQSPAPSPSVSAMIRVGAGVGCADVGAGVGFRHCRVERRRRCRRCGVGAGVGGADPDAGVGFHAVEQAVVVGIVVERVGAGVGGADPDAGVAFVAVAEAVGVGIEVGGDGAGAVFLEVGEPVGIEIIAGDEACVVRWYGGGILQLPPVGQTVGVGIGVLGKLEGASVDKQRVACHRGFDDRGACHRSGAREQDVLGKRGRDGEPHLGAGNEVDAAGGAGSRAGGELKGA